MQINVILALTGNGAFVRNQPTHGPRDGFETRVNATGGIKGRPVQFVVSDDQSNPQVDVQLANALIAKNAPVILGPDLLAGCSATMPLLKTGPVLYCLSPGGRIVPGSFAFTTSIAAYDLIAAQVRYFHETGIFGDWRGSSGTDASGQDGEQGFDLALARPENAGMSVVDREHFNVTDLSVEAQLTRMKAANPDAVVTWTSGTQMGTLLRGGSPMPGLEKLPLMISAGNLGYRQRRSNCTQRCFRSNSYSCANDVFSADAVTDPAVKQALLETRPLPSSAAGERADYLSSLAWGPAQLVVAALRRLGPDATEEQIRGYIAGLRGFAITDGRVDFPAIPQRGLASQNAFVVRWDAAGDRFVPVSRSGGVPLR